ncbi:DNA-binding MarR family transcriptional regulator [Cytobacillus eiseniae]|uniref:DNA-binding MarR family transcriptional regulator n=1 Tax=Cytobacillus eiseniae TaxID=762947 RepID=A0ABS4RK84_9BACI|nr:MarR family transcriptional regulator [Cytobacillus eiseniae]MBP2243303.1 DNA-binding MarR family transcriptional regulator [Cytobacillus eiseniae]
MVNESEKLIRSTQLLRSFWSIQKNIVRFVQKTAVENGLSVPQYTVLMTIILQKEMTQKQVGEQTFLPKSTLSQAVDGLVRLGLLNRQQLESNRREMQLSITEKGEAFLKKMHLQDGGIHHLFQSAMEPLTDKQYEDLLESHLILSTYLESQAREGM